MVIDPGHPNIRRTTYYAHLKTIPLIKNGDPHNKVDVVILPDGYTQDEMSKFIKDATKMTDVLFGTSPFKERKKDFNVNLVALPSNESGIDNPKKGIYVDNALACSFNSFDSDRYVLTWANKIIRKVASVVPYDFLYILINSSKYGGGGIYQLYSTCTSDDAWSDYVFVHEFGHSFGGLGDEYYTSDVAYEEFYPTDVEPWEPNITALVDPHDVKWKDLIEPGTPVPTPWDKALFDQKSSTYRKERKQLTEQGASVFTLDSLYQIQHDWIQNFFKEQTYFNKVGVFEGSGYASEGLYRPFIDCRMFSRSRTGFDPVCRRAIERVIDFYTH